MKPHERYWEDNLPKMRAEMERWFGGNGDEAWRRYPRALIGGMGYRSLLDAGAGFCAEYYGFRREYPEIAYTAMDITPGFVALGKERGIPMFLASVEDMPFEDTSFDCVYIRDTLRHIELYETAITEALRVSGREVTVVFCRSLTSGPDHNIIYDEDDSIYNNRYSQTRIKTFLRQHPLVRWFYFEPMPGKNGPDSLLRIFKHISTCRRYYLSTYNKYRVAAFWYRHTFAPVAKAVIRKSLGDTVTDQLRRALRRS